MSQIDFKTKRYENLMERGGFSLTPSLSWSSFWQYIFDSTNQNTQSNASVNVLGSSSIFTLDDYCRFEPLSYFNRCPSLKKLRRRHVIGYMLSIIIKTNEIREIIKYKKKCISIKICLSCPCTH